jgi:hypothetical protein
MMMSDFIALVGRLANMNATALIFMAIAVIIFGTITHKVATGMRSSVTLTVAGLIALLFWFHLWDTNEVLWGMIFTASIAVVGREAYQRLICR